MTLSLGSSSGPPKIRKNASKKNKKSWRKNVDMTEVEEYLEEARLEERTGGSLTEKKDKEIFILDTGEGGQEEISSRRKRKEIKPLKCHSLLQGLPGVPDPKPQRNRTRSLEDRMNPVVKKKLKQMAESGKVPKKMKEALASRAEHLKKKAETEQTRQTRRRTNFDFDLWDEGGEKKDKEEELDSSWVTPEAKVHTDIWTNNMVPKVAKNRIVKSDTLLPAVELPHPGQSYNPALSDHKDVLWKAALVEIAKEKEEKRIERQTTAMFPTRDQAPTLESYLKEMSEGIPELGGEEPEEEPEEETGEVSEEAAAGKQNKLRTRKQRRDDKIRARQERKKQALLTLKHKENQVFRLKTFKKELKAKDDLTKQRQKKKEEKKSLKLQNAIQLSGHKYQAPEIEVKLSDELTGNLRNLQPEGSLIEDRYKSLQRRNIIETRVLQKRAKMKVKRVDKRSHKMGWEEGARKEDVRRRNRKLTLAKKLKAK